MENIGKAHLRHVPNGVIGYYSPYNGAMVSALLPGKHTRLLPSA
jgi:hypothetical protein